MKMRKILCSLLSASLIAASLAVPVLADEEFELANYTAADYDIVSVDEATEKVCTTAEKIFTTNIDTTKEFYLTFDFNLSADGLIEIPKLKSNGTDVDKVGPRLKIAGGKLVTETNNSGGTNDLGACTAGTWYKAEIEGKTGDGQDKTSFRLYTAEGTLVQDTANNFYMRNLSSNNLSFNAMRVTNGSVRNVKLIQEKPDAITLLSEAAQLDAGSQMSFDYTMTRKDAEITKYSVTWSVYNAENTAPIENDAISITNGVLQVAGTLAADTDVTVRASATFGEKTLVGTKAISVKTVDVSGEKFDTITILGDETVKAGTNTTYTATTTKGGNSVTPADGDVVWKVYDSIGVNELKWVTVEDGVLSVPENTIPQNVILRASGTSGVISSSKTIAIEWADSDKETHYWQNTCDTDMNGAETAVSVDGSKAYKLTETWKVRIGNKEGYTFTEFDIKFQANGTGLNFCRNDGGNRSVDITSDGENIKLYNGNVVTSVDPDAWYHVEIAMSTTSNASCNVYKYDTNGQLGNRITKLQIDKRNNGNGGLDVFAGTIIDNIKVTVPIADAISLSAAHASMFPTEDNQITATATKKDLPITAEGIEWSVLDASNKPIIDGSVTIDGTGLMKASAMAPEGIVTVQAKTATATATVPIEIKSSEIFKMQNIGVNEDGDKVVKLYVKKLLAYDDDVVFVMAFYDENHALKEVRTLKGYGSNYTNIGEDNVNEVTVDWAIPSGFDKTTGEAKVFIWTAF